MSSKSAHTGFVGQSGVQEHSAGPHFPVISYCIGSADHRVASFQGVERHSYDAADHREDLARMKVAETITDAIFAARSDGSGYSYFVNCERDPEYGWVVGSSGSESKFDAAARNYPAVYADVVKKLEFLDSVGVGSADGGKGRPVCIGSWICDGELYVDISAVHDDLQDAIAWGKSNDQLAIYSLHESVDYPL